MSGCWVRSYRADEKKKKTNKIDKFFFSELDLSSNLLRGPLTRDLLPSLKSLESLNLDTNLLTSIHTSAFENFPFLTTLSLRHNQIDVLQDHAFSGLTSLQLLDLSYNGIVAVSGASLKHLSRLLVLNLTHNFLRFDPIACKFFYFFRLNYNFIEESNCFIFRTLSSDLVAPLPSLKELQLDGNDISIVARDAFSTVNHLESLSLKDNPLSCDCSLKPFAEWMLTANISQKVATFVILFRFGNRNKYLGKKILFFCHLSYIRIN